MVWLEIPVQISPQFEVWTENNDHYLDLTTKLAAVPLLINLLEQNNIKDKTDVSLNIDISPLYFLFIESHKLNIMWQKPQNTSISIHKYLQQSCCANPSKNGKDFVFHKIDCIKKYPSVYTNALHIMLGEVQFTYIQSLKSKNLTWT